MEVPRSDCWNTSQTWCCVAPPWSCSINYLNISHLRLWVFFISSKQPSELKFHNTLQIDEDVWFLYRESAGLKVQLPVCQSEAASCSHKLAYSSEKYEETEAPPLSSEVICGSLTSFQRAALTNSGAQLWTDNGWRVNNSLSPRESPDSLNRWINQYLHRSILFSSEGCSHTHTHTHTHTHLCEI